MVHRNRANINKSDAKIIDPFDHVKPIESDLNRYASMIIPVNETKPIHIYEL